ncbi:Copia proteinlike [Phytophthora palmivora]|uniref:Copia proteinlike n=1 Tax=Phytophthora palmivora TaxID=4796 RepID=A0A2P4YB62_9STRA|nr:Copia proteinlike [Phytophthora palmivora]
MLPNFLAVALDSRKKLSSVFTKVWHIPKLSRNLFSVGRFTKDVGPVTFERDGCFAETKKIKWQLGAREGKGLFKLCMTPIMPGLSEHIQSHSWLHLWFMHQL